MINVNPTSGLRQMPADGRRWPSEPGNDGYPLVPARGTPRCSRRGDPVAGTQIWVKVTRVFNALCGEWAEFAARASDGPTRLGRPHFIPAPDEAATETAADPEQRQEDVTQDKGRRRSKASVPSGYARECGFGAIPRRRDRKNTAQRQPQRRNDIRPRGERGET